MISKTCDICGKIIEGYSQNHVDYLMAQHNITHQIKGGKHGIQKEKTNRES